MKGYKVFNPDFTCRGFRYEVGKAYELKLNPDVCNTGFHFCKKAVDCFNYYNFDPANKVAEVVALGEIAEKDDKCATNKIQIVREIPWIELLNLVNIGKGNTGYSNSGHSNSGDHNSGDSNSGRHNSGDSNSGDWNSGDSNSGHSNSGHHNSGHSNSGYSNSGDSNSGDHNSGDSNSGDHNSGHHNSGDSNSGRHNSGDSNSGRHNSGRHNSGDWNSGRHNSGDWNQGDFSTGDFNTVDHETGCFCTEEHKIRIFDQESEMTFREWRNSKAYQILCGIPFEPTTWIWPSDMTDDEKAAHPEHRVTNGYLRINNTDRDFLIWWDSLTSAEKKIIKGIPNFNPEKFKLITGIEV